MYVMDTRAIQDNSLAFATSIVISVHNNLTDLFLKNLLEKFSLQMNIHTPRAIQITAELCWR